VWTSSLLGKGLGDFFRVSLWQVTPERRDPTFFMWGMFVLGGLLLRSSFRSGRVYSLVGKGREDFSRRCNGLKGRERKNSLGETSFEVHTWDVLCFRWGSNQTLKLSLKLFKRLQKTRRGYRSGSESIKEKIRVASERIQCVYVDIVDLENCDWISFLVDQSVKSTDDESLALNAKRWASVISWSI
jgi:hypothetical protein